MHKITWFGVATDGERIRRNSTMPYKDWGWDATCTCGWDSRTGGCTASHLDAKIAAHKSGPSEADVQDALAALKKELERPAFTEAVTAPLTRKECLAILKGRGVTGMSRASVTELRQAVAA